MKRFAILTAFLWILAASGALACSCEAPPEPKAALATATAVFTGKVTGIEPANKFEKAVTLEITAAWKGVEKKKEVVIYTANDGAACGYGFEKGKSYLVYAHEEKRKDDKILGTNICTRTALAADAKADFKALGEAKK